MGRTKKNWLLFCNKVLSFFLLLLGFSACSEEERKDMYGMPPAKFSVKANVLDEENNPLKGIKVDIKADSKANYGIESGVTDANGIFETKVYLDKVNIVCTDIDGEKNGTYKKDSVQADISKEENLAYEFTIRLKEDK